MKTISKYLKVILVTLFIIFEEIAWRRIGEPAYKAVSALQIMDNFKSWVSDINHRYLLLLVFIVPFVLMEGASALAFKAWGSGLIFSGLAIYSIKLILTAPVVVIFNTGKEILLTFWVIRTVYGWIEALKNSKTFKGIKKYGSTIIDTYFKSTDKSMFDGLIRFYQKMKS